MVAKNAAGIPNDAYQEALSVVAPTRRRAWFVVIRSFVIAGIAAGTIVRFTDPPLSDVLTVTIAWICFYPVARLNPRQPWWAHWARGAVILFAFLLTLWYWR